MSKLPQIHGHRGARGQAPENTLVAVQCALDCAVDGVEVDLCVSADRHLVLHHDLHLNRDLTRDADGGWIKTAVPVHSLTLEQLRQLNVGQSRPRSLPARRFPHQKACRWAAIPTLPECIDLLLPHPQVTLNLELKGAPHRPDLVPAVDRVVAQLLRCLDGRIAPERLFVQSFDWRLVLALKKRAPAIKIGLLTSRRVRGDLPTLRPGQPTAWHNYLDVAQHGDSIVELLASTGAEVWSCHYSDLTRPQLARAHALGLAVYVWTVNRSQDMQRMLDWRVDAITTDYPARALALRAGAPT